MPDNKPKADEPKADENAAAPAVDAVSLRERRKALAAELAALDADAQAQGVTLQPTHVLTLSNGSSVESVGAVSTHHSTPDGIFAVVRADEI